MGFNVTAFLRKRAEFRGVTAANDAIVTPVTPLVTPVSTVEKWKKPNEINVVTPVTPNLFIGVTKKPNEINAVTPVTPVTPEKTIIQEKIDTTANDWHQADRAYQAHHWSCPQCQASGKGYGPMCDEGQALWDAYEAAPMSELGKAKRVATSNQAPAPQTPPRMTPRSGAEIVRMVELYRRAINAGLPDDQSTDKLLDALMDAPSDMGCCFACNHLRGSSPQRWRCAGHGHELSGLPLARVFVVQLHRCAGYEPPPMT
jgi:hypothetical protein